MSWDAALLEGQSDTSLVRIARQRRLVLEDGQGPQWVELCWVDEAVLALIDLAREHGASLTVVYPAPAGQVAVLLAGQLLLHQFVRDNRQFVRDNRQFVRDNRQFVRDNRSSSVGIVTADPTMATRTWNALRIATTGAREPIADVFPSFRAGPEGESPGGGQRLRGVIIGQQCKGWPVDHLIVDHLAGLVRVDTDQPSIEVFADPLDSGLRRVEDSGRLIWGWSEQALADGTHVGGRVGHTVPFSVASDRLETLAGGIDVRLRVARHPAAEAATRRIREDLRVLRSMAPHRSDRILERGLSVAWHHLATLTSLPCKPSLFDHFAGVPPFAARATRTFASELSAWASTLSEDFAEIATILASDMADLRAALELGNPFEETLREIRASGLETIVVTRTQTASCALLSLFGTDPTAGRTGPLTVQHIGGLHRHGTWPRALMIGEPSPWDWHRLLCGLAPSVEVLTLGTQSAEGCASSIASLRDARDHWGGEETRERTWRALVGTSPPATPTHATRTNRPIVVLDGAEYVPEPDPFPSLSSLFDLNPLDIGGEGPASGLAREDEGHWTATVPAVEVKTNRGVVFLEVGSPVDVRVGLKITERRPELLQPGAILLVGRTQGRVGLLEALEERLSDRPDLMAARFLVDGYRRIVRTRFAESGLTIVALHRVVVDLGCQRTSAAVRSWVTDGTMAPQTIEDLQRLNTGLGLGLSDLQTRELFAGVQRRRGFRRAAGRALAAAARGSTIVADENRIDSETGLSIADLREAVVEAVVIEVIPCDGPLPLTLLGRLENS